MIPIKNIRIELEKDASKIGMLTKDIAAFILKHPVASLAIPTGIMITPPILQKLYQAHKNKQNELSYLNQYNTPYQSPIQYD